MEKLELIPPDRGCLVLAAVSGGADSVALLAVLKEWADEGMIRLHAAHFEHGIRGEESLSDAAFVRELCEDWSVPFHEGRADVPCLAQSRHIGLEQAARDARYAFLRQVKAEISADCIALAHHLDDQAETVLMHLLRGSGLRGVRGMAEHEGDLYRPFLGLRKAQLVAYLRERGVGWREDGTNAVADTPRNDLRLNVLPRLEQIYPGAVRAIGRFAALAAVEDDFMVREAERFLENNAEQTWVGLRLRSVSGVHPAILRRAIHELTGLGAEACLAVEALCRSGKGRISLENGLTAEKTGQSLYLLAPLAKAPLPVPLPEEGVARLGSIGEIRTRPCAPEPVRGEPFCQVLDRQSLVGACVRTRQAGDVIRPLGMSGEQKLSDYLINRRVDRPMRDAALLVARGRRVLWVAGVGMSEDARLREGSRGIRLEARENISKWRKNHGDVQGSGQNTDWRG